MTLRALQAGYINIIYLIFLLLTNCFRFFVKSPLNYSFQIVKRFQTFATFSLWASIQAAMGTMDFIIDTVSAVHPLAPLIALLKLNGKLITVGLPSKPLEQPSFPLVMGKPQLL